MLGAARGRGSVGFYCLNDQTHIIAAGDAITYIGLGAAIGSKDPSSISDTHSFIDYLQQCCTDK